MVHCNASDIYPYRHGWTAAERKGHCTRAGAAQVAFGGSPWAGGTGRAASPKMWVPGGALPCVCRSLATREAGKHARVAFRPRASALPCEDRGGVEVNRTCEELPLSLVDRWDTLA